MDPRSESSYPLRGITDPDPAPYPTKNRENANSFLNFFKSKNIIFCYLWGKFLGQFNKS